MGQAFYRKYRSKTLHEVIGQDHLTTILENSLKNGNLSHAYLFTGPRGVGKTSVARILAREVNSIKPDDDKFYSDIIEIDAASNRRIEEVRELRDKIAIAPSQLKFKVYIIDEVHMLTREAFNALLKTLEEPPAHAIFILATTDFHKVPDTIISRCMRLNFKSISVKDLSERLQEIAKIENVNVDEEAVELIAEQSDGSFRDALSILDQLSSTGNKINTDLVELNLGIAKKQSIGTLINEIAAANTSQIFELIQSIVDSGATPDQINKQLSQVLRQSLVQHKSIIPDDQAISLIENLNHMYSYQNQRIALELAILKVITPTKKSNIIQKTKVDKANPPLEIDTIIVAPSEEPKRKINTYDHPDKLWQEVLGKLKVQNNTLYGIARMAKASFKDDQLKLIFKFPFHLKQMELEKNRNLIMSIINQLKDGVDLVIVADNDSSNPAKISANNTPNNLKTVSNIFGSAEVIES